jgi:hypothetical protein
MGSEVASRTFRSPGTLSPSRLLDPCGLNRLDRERDPSGDVRCETPVHLDHQPAVRSGGVSDGFQQLDRLPLLAATLASDGLQGGSLRGPCPHAGFSSRNAMKAGSVVSFAWSSGYRLAMSGCGWGSTTRSIMKPASVNSAHVRSRGWRQ